MTFTEIEIGYLLEMVELWRTLPRADSLRATLLDTILVPFDGKDPDALAQRKQAVEDSLREADAAVAARGEIATTIKAKLYALHREAKSLRPAEPTSEEALRSESEVIR